MDGREDSVSLNIRRFHDTQDSYDQNTEQIDFLAESGKTPFCSNFESGLWIYLLHHLHWPFVGWLLFFQRVCAFCIIALIISEETEK